MKGLLLLLTLCITAVMPGQTSKKYNISNFTGVSVGWGMQLSVTQSDNFSVEIRADEDDFQYIDVEKDGSTLEISINRNNFRPGRKIQVAVSMPNLTSLGLSGGSQAKIKMNIESKEFTAGLSGGSKLEGNLSCGNSEFALSGGSVIGISGKGADLEIQGSGGSKFNLKDFSVRNVDAALSGGSQVKISMNGKLDVSASGGSDVVYYGNAEKGDTSFSGGSKVRKGN